MRSMKFFVCLVLCAACAAGWTSVRLGQDAPPAGSAAPAVGTATPTTGSAAPATGSAAPATGSTAPTTGSAAPASTDPKSSTADTAHLEKQIAAAQEKLSALQIEELEITTRLLAMQQQGMKNVKNPATALQDLAKGNKTGGLGEYKQALVSSGQQWLAFADKILRTTGVKALEAERAKAPADLQARIDEVVKNATDRYRTILGRAADMFDKGAEYKQAIAVYQTLFQSLPDDKRAADHEYRQKIGEIYFKISDWKNALACLKAAWDAMPQAERAKETKTLGIKMLDCLEKLNDYRAALDLANALLLISPGNNDLIKKINNYETRLNPIRPGQKKGGGGGAP